MIQAEFGEGSGPIFHSDLQCTSRENNLRECPGLHGRLLLTYLLKLDCETNSFSLY
jgi:hypothetical protein